MDNDAPFVVNEDDSLQDVPVVVVNATGEDAQEELPPGATWNPDGSVTLTLLKQAKLTVRTNGTDASQEYPTLQFKPLTGKQMLGILDKSSGSRTIALIAASLGFSPLMAKLIIEQMDARDYVRAVEICGVFTDSGR